VCHFSCSCVGQGFLYFHNRTGRYVTGNADRDLCESQYFLPVDSTIMTQQDIVRGIDCSSIGNISRQEFYSDAQLHTACAPSKNCI
jgi:hypothetical protein